MFLSGLTRIRFSLADSTQVDKHPGEIRTARGASVDTYSASSTGAQSDCEVHRPVVRRDLKDRSCRRTIPGKQSCARRYNSENSRDLHESPDYRIDTYPPEHCSQDLIAFAVKSGNLAQLVQVCQFLPTSPTGIITWTSLSSTIHPPKHPGFRTCDSMRLPGGKSFPCSLPKEKHRL